MTRKLLVVWSDETASHIFKLKVYDKHGNLTDNVAEGNVHWATRIGYHYGIDVPEVPNE